MKVVINVMACVDSREFRSDELMSLKRKLTVYPQQITDISSKDEPKPIRLYTMRSDKIFGIPRAYYQNHKTGSHDEVLRICRGIPMQQLGTKFKAEGPFVGQIAALDAMMNFTKGKDYGGFLLEAACGSGKTVVCLEFARRLGVKTLIIVHKNFFMHQWKERIEEFIPDARVGMIQQDTCDYKDKDFVIAMVQSLVNDEGSKYPREIYSSNFGLIATDEAHRISCQSWEPIVSRFNAAWRVGLSATFRRHDKAENVFYYHIGAIVHSAKVKSLVPKLRRIYTEFEPKPIQRGSYNVDANKLNTAQLISQMGEDKFRSRSIIDDVVEGVRLGRKIMVVSHRLEHLRQMAIDLNNVLMRVDLPFVPKVDFYVGEWFTGDGPLRSRVKKRERKKTELKKAERANVIFSTAQMISEGLDISALDVIVLATPIGDAEQCIGRVRRWCTPTKEKCDFFCPWRSGKCEGKPHPLVVDVVDERVNKAMSKYRSRLKFYEEIGMKVD